MKRRPIASGHRVAPSRRRALRLALAGIGGWSLAGCDRLSDSPAVVGVIRSAEHLSHGVQRLVAGRPALAQEFGEADIASQFKGNGTLMPADADYRALLADGFRDYRLQVGGLVERATSFSLAELREMSARTQITRHDCVEGWSTIGKWKGVPLSLVLNRVRPLANARYVVFRCADSMDAPAAPADSRYYESIDMDDAYHLQTLLAYELNDRPLPVTNGAPLRLRVERQLGYKQAKYVMRIELVESFAGIRDGHGGYWEDHGYEWYAGI